MNHNIVQCIIKEVITNNDRTLAIKTLCALSKTCRLTNRVIKNDPLFKELTKYKTMNNDFLKILIELDHVDFSQRDFVDNIRKNVYKYRHELFAYIFQYYVWHYLDLIRQVYENHDPNYTHHYDNTLGKIFKAVANSLDILKYVTKYNVRYIVYSIKSVLDKKVSYDNYKYLNHLYLALILPFDHVGLYKDVIRKHVVKILYEYEPPKIIKYVIAKIRIPIYDAIKLAQTIPANMRDHNITRIHAMNFRILYEKMYEEIRDKLKYLDDDKKSIEKLKITS